MVRLLVAAALVTGAATFVVSCGGEGKVRPDLAFVSTRDGDYAIFEMGADGSGERRLTDADTDSLKPQGLFFQVEPAWSPDGTRIAFSSRRGGTFDIFVMDADGTGTRRLTSTPGDEAHPTWSPDGKRLAFARGRDIYVVNADGTGLLRITSDQTADIEPAWSPDGRWIAYVKGANETVGKDLREVWLIRPDGTRSHSLTTLGVSSYSPAWSPDSSRIAFASDMGKGGIFDIYTVGVDGKGLRRLTRIGPDAFEPAWSPDGKTIAFSRGGAIVIIDLEGNEEEITDRDDNDSSPAWNPRPPEVTG